MHTKKCRIACGLFAIVLLLFCLPACDRVDPLAKSGIRSVTADANGKVTVTATVNVQELESLSEKKACLYALAPGQSSVAEGRLLAETELEHNLQFTFDLNEKGFDLLSASYTVAVDGTPLSDGKLHWIENPEVLAKNKTAFLWDQSPKGLNTSDPAAAFETGAMHVMYQAALSQIANTDGTLNEAALSELDQQIASATSFGMQVSLTLDPDLPLSDQALFSALSALCARYSGGEHGTVSALFPVMNGIYDNALLCRLSTLALRAQVANGRVYMLSRKDDPEEIKFEFADLALKLSEGNELGWNAALSVSADIAPWEDAGAVASPTVLKEIFTLVLNEATGIRASRMALCDVTYSMEDTEQQAVSFAYTWRAARAASVHMIFYGTHFDGVSGLFDENGQARPALSVFKDIDTGLSPADLALCETRAKEAFTALAESAASRSVLSGVANAGKGNLKEKTLFDFGKGDTHGFVSVASPEAAQIKNSAALGSTVLYTWMDPTQHADSGVRCVLQGADSLSNVSALSVTFLAQAKSKQAKCLVLTLEGHAENGQRLSYQSNVAVNGATWQTATFQIGAFTAEVDPEKPVVLSLTVQTDPAQEEEFVLWIQSLNTQTPTRNLDFLLPLGVALLGIAVGFMVFVIWHRKASRSR